MPSLSEMGISQEQLGIQAKPVTPESTNQAAQAIIDVMGGLGNGFNAAAMEKVQEYARRIANNEDPRKMGIPKSMQPHVEAAYKQLLADSNVTKGEATPIVPAEVETESPTDVLADLDNELAKLEESLNELHSKVGPAQVGNESDFPDNGQFTDEQQTRMIAAKPVPYTPPMGVPGNTNV
jgi:hypothetical protein